MIDHRLIGLAQKIAKSANAIKYQSYRQRQLGYYSFQKGNGIDFKDVKQYIFGDDIRRVDWNVSSRTGEIYVKEYWEEKSTQTLFLVDVSSSTIPNREIYFQLLGFYLYLEIFRGNTCKVVLVRDSIVLDSQKIHSIFTLKKELENIQKVLSEFVLYRNLELSPLETAVFQYKNLFPKKLFFSDFYGFPENKNLFSHLRLISLKPKTPKQYFGFSFLGLETGSIFGSIPKNETTETIPNFLEIASSDVESLIQEIPKKEPFF